MFGKSCDGHDDERFAGKYLKYGLMSAVIARTYLDFIAYSSKIYILSHAALTNRNSKIYCL